MNNKIMGKFALVGFIGLGLLVSCAKKEVKSGDALSAAATDQEANVASAGDSETLKKAYFDFDRYTLTAEARKSLRENADWLKKDANAQIQVEGHCDERGTTEYNLALGERRANVVKDFLKNLGVDPARVTIVSYGNERPADSGHDEAAWAKNRRAVSVILKK
jgi:peptidoglycan-associated lipoprotein